MATCALIVGHSPSAGGALSVGGINEFAFNDPLARLVAASVRSHTVHLVHRLDTLGGYRHLSTQVNRLQPDFAVELHFNAVANPTATGSEVVFWHADDMGALLAAVVLAEIVHALDLPARGIKGRRSGERGAPLLSGCECPTVLAEPFFGSNPLDWSTAVSRKAQLTTAYVAAIEKFGHYLDYLRARTP